MTPQEATLLETIKQSVKGSAVIASKNMTSKPDPLDRKYELGRYDAFIEVYRLLTNLEREL